MLGSAAIFRAAIGRRTGELRLPFVEEGRDPVIQEIGRGDRRLAIPRVAALPRPRTGSEFGERHFRSGVDEGLLSDAADPFHVADMESVLGAAAARALALES